MSNLFIGLIILANILIVINAIKCDFDKFANGCEDWFGSQCNKTLNKCECKPGFTIKIDDYCFPPKNLSEPCFISAQCSQFGISNIGCFTEEKEIDVKTLKSWINSDNVFKVVGICTCPPGYILSSHKECVPKKLFNENCTSSQECIAINSYCDQVSKKCKCKPTFRYSVRKSKCVAQVVGASCSDNEHCLIHDPNAECRIGSCQCRSGFILSNSGKCVFVRIKGTSNHLLMMFVVLGTAVVLALLSTAHKKWSTSDDIFETNNRRNQPSANFVNRRTFQSSNNYPQSINCHRSYPMPLSAPSLALIWPLRHQNESPNNQFYLEDGPPSYAEAISQSMRQSDINAHVNHDNSNNEAISSSDNNNNNNNNNNADNNPTIISNTIV